MKLHCLVVIVLSYVYLQTVNLCSSRVLVLESILHFGVERICLYVAGCVKHCDWNWAHSDNILISDLYFESIVLCLDVIEVCESGVRCAIIKLQRLLS